MVITIVFVEKKNSKRKKKKNQERCSICQIPIIFSNFEADLSNNMFNKNFLKEY